MYSDSSYYEIDSKKSLIFTATHLLVLLRRDEFELNSISARGDRQAKEAIVLLLEKELITLDSDLYILTEAGKEKADQFQVRYSNILTYVDIYGFVDLANGEFAFRQFGTFSSDDQWRQYISESRWTDLRIAMIDHLDGDATELVFAQQILEDNISRENISWKDIEDICNNALQEEDLSYENGNTLISGLEVLDDIYDKAVELLKAFHPEDSEIQRNLNTWYHESDEPEKSMGYGSSIKIKASSTTSPPWETSWTI